MSYSTSGSASYAGSNAGSNAAPNSLSDTTADSMFDSIPASMSSAASVVYPRPIPDFSAVSLEALLEPHVDLIRRIKMCFGADRATFERDVLTLVRRYAAFVHLLPATPNNYFDMPGGLLQLGLETAFFALQGTDAHIFSGRSTITTRRHLEPRWRLATFIGGLCGEIHRTVGRVTVTDQRGREWPSYMVGLLPWMQHGEIARYLLKWRPDAPANPVLSLFVLPHIVPAATLQHLAEGNSVIVPHLMASLSSTLPHDNNILDQLVRRSAALVIDRFLRTSAERDGQLRLGDHLERYLIAALRRLIATDPAWQPNAERSRVWFGADGLFIVWPQAAADVRKLLEADQLVGMPRSAETMQEILMRAGVLQARSDGGGLWTINPPTSRAAVEALKFSAAELLLDGLAPRPTRLPATLCVQTVVTARVARPDAAAARAGTQLQPGAPLDSPLDAPLDSPSTASSNFPLQTSFPPPSLPPSLLVYMFKITLIYISVVLNIYVI